MGAWVALKPGFRHVSSRRFGSASSLLSWVAAEGGMWNEWSLEDPVRMRATTLSTRKMTDDARRMEPSNVSIRPPPLLLLIMVGCVPGILVH